MNENVYVVLYILLIFITIQIQNVTSMPKIASRKRPRMPRECDGALCNSEGTCELNQLGYAKCTCYEQYFTGITCQEVTSNCIYSTQGCIISQTEECWDYYGGHHCICKKFFYGKRCQQYGYIANFASFLVVLSRHQPVISIDNFIIVAFGRREDTRKISLQLDGFGFEYYVQNFSRIDPKNLKKMASKNNFFPPHVAQADISIPQKNFLLVPHQFLHPGRKKMYLTSYIVFKFTEAWSYWAQAKDEVGHLWNMAKDYGGQALSSVANIGSNIVGAAGNIASGVVSGVESAVFGTISGAESAVSGAIGTATGAVSGVASSVLSGAGAVASGVGSVMSGTLDVLEEAPVVGGLFGSIGSTMSSLSSYIPSTDTISSYIPGTSSVTSYIPSVSDVTSYIPGMSTVSDYIPSSSTVTDYIPSVSTVASYIPGGSTALSYLPDASTALSYIPGASTVQSYLPSVSSIASYIPGGSYVSSWWYGGSPPDEAPPEYDEHYQLDREWNDVHIANAIDEFPPQVYYEDGYKITVVKLLDQWTFEYEPVFNASLCTPDFSFRGGVCSVFSVLPTILLKTKRYRFDSATLNVCGKDSILPEPVFYYKHIENVWSMHINEITADKTTFQRLFKLQQAKPDVFQGWVYQIVGEATEIDELIADSLTRPRETFVGRDVCWIQYHSRLPPVVELDSGAQITLSTSDTPTVHSFISFIDDINTNIPDDMGGNLTYYWECFKTAYGWIYMNGCDNWFTSEERNKTLSFWFTVQGYIKFTACVALDKEKYNTEDTESCAFTQFSIIVNGGYIDSWVYPLFFITCMRNCGQGTENAYSDVDRGEIVFLKTSCQTRCEKTELFRWYFNDLYIPDDDGAFLRDTVERKNLEQLLTTKQENYKMIKPFAFSTINKHVGVQVMGVDDQHYGWAKFHLRYWVPPLDNSVFFPSNCQEPKTYKGTAFYTDFFLCLKNVDLSTPMTFYYYQSVSEFDSKLGVMIGHGQAPYLKDAILASSVGRTKITIAVSNDVIGSEYLDTYDEIEVVPPEERSAGPYAHMVLIKDIFDGKRRKNRLRSSVPVSARKNELTELVQKLHVIIVELTQVGLSRHISDQLEIDEERNQIIFDSISVISQLRTTLPVDIAQLASILYEYAYIDALPMDYQRSEAIMNALAVNLENFDEVINAEWFYREKPYRVLRLVGPVVDIISAVLYPASNTIYSTLNEPMSKYVMAVTKDLIKVMDYEESLLSEHYPAYQSEGDNLRKTLDRYANTTLKAFVTMKQILKTLSSTLLPTPKAPEIFWPALQLTTYGVNSMYLYVKLDEPEYFNGLNYEIGDSKHFLINFTYPVTRRDLTTSNIALLIASMNSMPFWWQKNSNINLPFAMLLMVINENAHTLRSNFTVRYAVPLKKDDYAKGNAVPLDKTGGNSIVSCHIIRIPPNYPTYFTAFFDRSLSATLKVIPRTKQCPTIDEFHKLDRVQFVGPNIMSPVAKTGPVISSHKKGSSYSSSHNFGVTYTLPSKNFTIFAFLGVISSSRSVSYSVQFHASKCSTWRVKNDSTFSLNNYYWDDKNCKNLKVLETGTALECECTTSNDTNIFSPTHSLLETRIYGWMALSLDYRIQHYYLLFLLVIGILLIFGFLFSLAYLFDSKDEQQKKVLYLVDNRPLERYMYVIVVITGSSSPSRSSSHIGIKLFGHKGNSKRHVLVGIREKETLKRMGIDFFGLTTIASLGKMRAVELWSDYRGCNPDWYCEKVIVRDYNKMIEWVFVVKKWFSLIHSNQHVHRVLYQTKKSIPSFCERVFTSEDLLLHHIWIGMFSREHCHAFSRKYKVLMAYSIMNISLFMLLFLYGIPELQNDAVADVGHIHVDVVLVNGIISLIVSIIVNYPLLYTLKNSQVDKDFNPHYYDFSGVDPTTPYPFYKLNYKTKFVAWTVIAIFGFSTNVIIFFIGTDYGIRKSQMLLESLVFCCVLDLVFVETLHVIIRGFIWRGLMMNNDVKRFCNEIIDIDCLDDYPLANSKNKELLIKKDMLQPMPSALYRVLLQREKYFSFYAHLLKDLTIYACFLLTFFLLMANYRDSYSYYNSEVMENLIVKAKYTHTLPLKNISTIQDFFDYLNYTLILTIHWQSPCWLADTDIKLVGLVRLRQNRLNPELISPCISPPDMGDFRFRCIPEFSTDLMDTDIYSIAWMPYNASIFYSYRMKSAFMYQTAGETATVPRTSVNTYIPGGGYTVTLGRNIRNSRTVLNTLSSLKWFDDYTRLVTVEFTTLNVHSNLFTFVTITIERSATGDFIPSYNIKSVVLENRKSFGHGVEFILFVLLIVVLGFMLLQQSKNFMHRHDVDAATPIWMILDLTVFICASYVVYYIYVKYYSLYHIYSIIEQSPNNTFVSFGDVLRIQLDIRVIGSLLLFLSLIRMWKLLRFSRKYQLLDYFLHFLQGPILSLTVVLIVFCAMAALLMYLMFGTRFMIWWNFYKIPNHIEYYYEGYLTVGILYFLFKIILRSTFVIVIIISYQKAQRVMKNTQNRFTFGLYIKERIFRRDTSDIIRLGFDGHLEDVV